MQLHDFIFFCPEVRISKEYSAFSLYLRLTCWSSYYFSCSSSCYSSPSSSLIFFFFFFSFPRIYYFKPLFFFGLHLSSPFHSLRFFPSSPSSFISPSSSSSSSDLPHRLAWLLHKDRIRDGWREKEGEEPAERHTHTHTHTH